MNTDEFRISSHGFENGTDQQRIPPPLFYALLQRLQDDLQGLRTLKHWIAQRKTIRTPQQDERQQNFLFSHSVPFYSHRDGILDKNNDDDNIEHLNEALRGMAAVFGELNGSRHGSDVLWLAQQQQYNMASTLATKEALQIKSHGSFHTTGGQDDHLQGNVNSNLDFNYQENDHTVNDQGWNTEPSWAFQCFGLLRSAFTELHGIIAGCDELVSGETRWLCNGLTTELSCIETSLPECLRQSFRGDLSQYQDPTLPFLLSLLSKIPCDDFIVLNINNILVWSNPRDQRQSIAAKESLRKQGLTGEHSLERPTLSSELAKKRLTLTSQDSAEVKTSNFVTDREESRMTSGFQILKNHQENSAEGERTVTLYSFWMGHSALIQRQAIALLFSLLERDVLTKNENPSSESALEKQTSVLGSANSVQESLMARQTELERLMSRYLRVVSQELTVVCSLDELVVPEQFSERIEHLSSSTDSSSHKRNSWSDLWNKTVWGMKKQTEKGPITYRLLYQSVELNGAPSESILTCLNLVTAITGGCIKITKSDAVALNDLLSLFHRSPLASGTKLKPLTNHNELTSNLQRYIDVIVASYCPSALLVGSQIFSSMKLWMTWLKAYRRIDIHTSDQINSAIVAYCLRIIEQFIEWNSMSTKKVAEGTFRLAAIPSEAPPIAGSSTIKGIEYHYASMSLPAIRDCAAVSFISDSPAQAGMPSLHFISESNTISKLLRNRRGAILINVDTLRDVVQNTKDTANDSSTTCSDISVFQWQKDMLVGTVVEAIDVLDGLLSVMSETPSILDNTVVNALVRCSAEVNPGIEKSFELDVPELSSGAEDAQGQVIIRTSRYSEKAQLLLSHLRPTLIKAFERAVGDPEFAPILLAITEILWRIQNVDQRRTSFHTLLASCLALGNSAVGLLVGQRLLRFIHGVVYEAIEVIAPLLPGLIKMISCHPRQLYTPVVSLIPTILDLSPSRIKSRIITSVFNTISELPLLTSIVHTFRSLNLAVVCCASLGLGKSQTEREPRTSLGQELHPCKVNDSSGMQCPCQAARILSQYCFQLGYILSASKSNASRHTLLRLSRELKQSNCCHLSTTLSIRLLNVFFNLQLINIGVWRINHTDSNNDTLHESRENNGNVWPWNFADACLMPVFEGYWLIYEDYGFSKAVQSLYREVIVKAFRLRPSLFVYMASYISKALIVSPDPNDIVHLNKFDNSLVSLICWLIAHFYPTLQEFNNDIEYNTDEKTLESHNMLNLEPVIRSTSINLSTEPPIATSSERNYRVPEKVSHLYKRAVEACFSSLEKVTYEIIQGLDSATQSLTDHGHRILILEQPKLVSTDPIEELLAPFLFQQPTLDHPRATNHSIMNKNSRVIRGISKDAEWSASTYPTVNSETPSDVKTKESLSPEMQDLQQKGSTAPTFFSFLTPQFITTLADAVALLDMWCFAALHHQEFFARAILCVTKLLQKLERLQSSGSSSKWKASVLQSIQQSLCRLDNRETFRPRMFDDNLEDLW